ncbi:MAG: TfoX/Sxy family protein [Bacillota bacterium]|jgi:TfoX/Sxy family transcriptional regulator of competence genes
MATSKEYLEFVLEQLSGIEGVRHLKMMGEYVLYYRDKVFGGLYDNRFLVKNIPAAVELLPEPVYEIPYEGAKPMLLVEDIEDRDFLERLLTAMYAGLPAPKPKKQKNN